VPEAVGASGGVRASWIVAEYGAYDVAGAKFMISEGPITRIDDVPSNDANRITFQYPVGCVSSSESCSMGEGSSTLRTNATARAVARPQPPEVAVRRHDR
jgi:hypothetical protein